MATDTAPPLVTDSYHVDSPHLGASKIADYLKCPAAYHKRYIEKLRMPKLPQAVFGTCFHSVVQMAHEAKWDFSHAAKAGDCLRAFWEQKRQYTTDPDSPDVAQSLEQACNIWLPWYLNFVSKQITVDTELHWGADGGMAYCGVALEGTIDRIYHLDGQVVISDVKTGKRKEEMHNNIQATLYSWAAREMGLREDRIEQVWLRTAETLPTIRDDEYIEAVMQDTVLHVARGIAAGVFPCNPASKYGCNFCEFTSICAVGKGCAA